MIKINNVLTQSGKRIDLQINSSQSIAIQAEDLLLLPGLIDPHVHFRTPGLEYKEDWCTAARASIKGGYTRVFDMPNTLPPTITLKALEDKQKIINDQLKAVNIPLRYNLFFGADKHHIAEIKKVKEKIIGIKVFMGCSTGGLLIDDIESLDAIFKIAAEEGLLVAVHAEDEQRLKKNKQQIKLPQPYQVHTKIRDETSAIIAVKQAIALVRKYGTRLYVLHISTQQEVELIAAAKAEGLPVYAEITPHHLFLNTQDYNHLQGKAIVNPPLRDRYHNQVLFDAIKTGIIDTIGSDHAPHTLHEKTLPYGQCPSGMPGIETTLPLLLNAYHQNLLSIEDIVKLTSQRVLEIFSLPKKQDYTLVDLKAERTVDSKNLATKCRWSAYNGKSLRGWPVYTILEDRCYKISDL